MYLKKGIHILISAILLVATTGLTVSEHYCQNRLVEKTIAGPVHSCCDDDNCCRNETSTFQVQDQFTFSEIHVNGPAGIPVIMILWTPQEVLLQSQIHFTENQGLTPGKIPLSVTTPGPDWTQEFLI